MKDNNPETELVEKWMIGQVFKEWTSVHDITEKFNKAHDPFSVSVHNMGRILKRLGFYRKTKDRKPHYLKVV